MSHMQNALRGYAQTKRETASEREIELQIFSNITGLLRSELTADRPGLTADLAKALTLNAKLWNLLFCDLINPNNGLPLDLKESLIALSEFTQSHTQKVLRGEAGFSVLIDINDSVILGLKTAILSQKSQAAATAIEGSSAPMSNLKEAV